MAAHPDLEAEQAYIDRAYECLEASREAATRLSSMVEVGRGGTEQARFERDVIWDTMLHRLSQLHLGDASLCFGRIDSGGRPDARTTSGASRSATTSRSRSSSTGGRRWPSRSTGPPAATPWAWPAAVTSPPGAAMLLGLEDELFGDAAAAARAGPGGRRRRHLGPRRADLGASRRARSGQLGDIVATIQGEQDEIIRAELPGVLVVQGGPGTGKTVVALHRAAYLLYTYRFPLEGQGVLVVGPNRLFLGYIEQVLPSLGEAGVELAVLADLVDGVRVQGRDTRLTARVKGDLRMVKVLRRAVRDRERPLRRRPGGAATA